MEYLGMETSNSPTTKASTKPWLWLAPAVEDELPQAIMPIIAKRQPRIFMADDVHGSSAPIGIRGRDGVAGSTGPRGRAGRDGIDAQQSPVGISAAKRRWWPFLLAFIRQYVDDRLLECSHEEHKPPEFSRGPRGYTGPRGLQGVPGSDGANGIDGANGKDAPRVVAVTRNGASLIFTFEGGQTYAVPLSDGATGATGPQGDKGDKGDKGDTGDAGGIFNHYYVQCP